MKKIFKIIILLVVLTCVAGFDYFLGQRSSIKKNGDLFSWEPPKNILISPSTNITDSITCRFKKSFSTFFMKEEITNSNLNPPDAIFYNFSDDNEADTVTFSDLNTDHPKVVTNKGESELTVLNNNPDSITLINLNGINDKIFHDFSTYKIFKKKGVLIDADMADQYTILGPTGGTLEMGYCN